MLQRNPSVETHSIEAEQALLGCILNQNEALAVVEGIVAAEHFFEPVHQVIFGVLQKLIPMGWRADAITLRPFLPAAMEIGSVNLGQYLARLAAEATTIINARDYAWVVRNFSDRRALAQVGHSLQPTDSQDVEEASNRAIDQIAALVSARQPMGLAATTMRDAASRALQATVDAYRRPDGIIGLPTRLRDLDNKMLGAQAGALILLAGRPSMGKTAVGIHLAMSFAEHGPGVFFSLEMNDTQLLHRMLSASMYDTKRVTYHQLRSGRVSEEQFLLMRELIQKLAHLPIHIEQKPGLTIGQVSARARQYKARHGLCWIIVDYLQLIQATDRYAGSRVNEVAEVSMGLKVLAKELGVPIIALSQLSRAVDAREDKRPNMADLRDSGSLEQDADVVMFIYRESYYLQHREPPPGTENHIKWQDAMERAWNKAEIIIGKQRAGPVGSVEVFCDIGHNVFRDLAPSPVQRDMEFV